jgi:hypothetical protein
MQIKDYLLVSGLKYLDFFKKVNIAQNKGQFAVFENNLQTSFPLWLLFIYFSKP